MTAVRKIVKQAELLVINEYYFCESKLLAFLIYFKEEGN